MWIPAGERECFCGLHIGGKSIRKVADVAGRGEDLVNSPLS